MSPQAYHFLSLLSQQNTEIHCFSPPGFVKTWLVVYELNIFDISFDILYDRWIDVSIFGPVGKKKKKSLENIKELKPALKLFYYEH